MRASWVYGLLFLVVTQSGCRLLTVATQAMQRCHVDSEPAGANIIVNGREVGTAPCEVPYPMQMLGKSGFHFVARLEGHGTEMETYKKFPSYVLFEMKAKAGQGELPAATRKLLDCTLADLPPVAEGASLAVLDFQVGEDGPSDVGQALADYCRETVQQSERFVLVDRQNMLALLTEEDFGATFRCDDTRCLVDFGKKLRAQKIIHGRASRVGDVHVLTLKLVDVGSAKIEAIRNAKMPGQIEDLLDLVEPATCELLHDALRGCDLPAAAVGSGEPEAANLRQ